jgi:transposase-like protein
MVTTTTELIDSGEKRDTMGRKRTPLERRRELVREYRGSGMTQANFAQRAGINYTTFCGWVQAEAKKQSQPVKFAQLQLPPALPAVAPLEPTELEVRLCDGTSVRGNKAEELAALVRALRS